MGTWTIEGIGSNTTGSFNIPANTGSTSLTYEVQYDDGNGGGGSTSFTVPACGKKTNIIKIDAIQVSNTMMLNLVAAYAPTSTITCGGECYYTAYQNGSLLQSKITWSKTLDVGVGGASWNVPIDGLNSVGGSCISIPGIASDDTYDYQYAPSCS